MNSSVAYFSKLRPIESAARIAARVETLDASPEKLAELLLATVRALSVGSPRDARTVPLVVLAHYHGLTKDDLDARGALYFRVQRALQRLRDRRLIVFARHDRSLKPGWAAIESHLTKRTPEATNEAKKDEK